MYTELKNYLSSRQVELVAVSKTKPTSDITELYDQGQRIFGENRVQELVSKHEELPKDIQWHMIGSLQKNKVKYIAPFISLIHSVGSLDLAKTINKEAQKNDRSIDVLLQIKIAQEETKAGYSFENLTSELEELIALEHVDIRGVMGMGTFTSDEEVTIMEFGYLKECFHKLKDKHFSTKKNFTEISMGMSGDYKLAVEAGSTMVRIGSLLFGARY